MAEIELRDVSLTFSAPPQPVAFRLYEIRKEQMQEDLPVKSPAGVKALEHVNLIVPDGQTYVVVGPSGCGKSSLLRVVAGIGDVVKLAGSANMLNSQKLRELRHLDWSVSVDELARPAGWQPHFSLVEGFAQTVAWYRRAGWL